MAITKPVLLLVALAAVLTGCGAPSGSDAATSSAVPSTNPPAPGAPLAFRDADGRLKCPVMGTQIVSEKEASGFSDHDGKRYYFCCGACKPKFVSDPHQYVKH